MPIPASSIMQLTFRGIAFGQRIIHTRTFHCIAGYESDGTAQDFQSDFLDATTGGGVFDLATKYRGALSSSYFLTEVRAQIIYPTRYSYTFIAPSPNPPGLLNPASAAVLSANCEALTALAGRKQVANYKIGPISGSDCVNGNTGPALATALSIYASTLNDQIGTLGDRPTLWDSVIFHRGKNGLPSTYDKIVDGKAYPEVRAKTTRTLRRGE